MHTIMYDLPTVANKEQLPFLQFQQRGNTCWYYTAKMLLRFHKMATTAQDIHYEQLKSLHKVRQISTAISKRQYGKDVKKSVVRDLGVELQKVQEQVKKIQQEALISQNTELQEVIKPPPELTSNEERLNSPSRW